MVDIFERLEKNAGGPIGMYMGYAHGYFAFPKLEGEIGPHMTFRGQKMLNWSLNNYLGLANHPEVREADAKGAAEFGMAAPMGARMMSGQTKYHEQLERELAEFVGKPDAFLLNFGYQGMISIIDCLLTPRDVVVYDAEAHACIIDGLRMHKGKRFVYGHNDMASLRLQLKHATELAEQQNGGVLVITEGVFGMKGDLGKLDEIVAMKKDFNFRLLVDDAHGFGTMGPHGRGTAAHFGVVDGVDVLFNTFAKSMAGIGAFVCGPRWLINLLRYNMRSQLYAKSLPMPMVIGALKRLDLIRKHPEYQEKLWEITRALQGGLKELNKGGIKAFITTFRNGDVVVAQRNGSFYTYHRPTGGIDRHHEAIDKLWSISIPKMAESQLDPKTVRGNMRDTIQAVLVEEIEKQIARQLAKHGGNAG